VDIETSVVHGRFPKRALRLVLEWLDLHKDDLIENWQKAKERRPLQEIDPLE